MGEGNQRLRKAPTSLRLTLSDSESSDHYTLRVAGLTALVIMVPDGIRYLVRIDTEMDDWAACQELGYHRGPRDVFGMHDLSWTLDCCKCTRYKTYGSLSMFGRNYSHLQRMVLATLADRPYITIHAKSLFNKNCILPGLYTDGVVSGLDVSKSTCDG